MYTVENMHMLVYTKYMAIYMQYVGQYKYNMWGNIHIVYESLYAIY
jgi:hypothetical protein